MTCGKLIKINVNNLLDDEIFTTASETLPKKTISKNRIDWFFEKDSTTISESLISFINENIEGEELTHKNLFTTIKNDGFAYNSAKNKYLKNQNIYYPVYQNNDEHNSFFMLTKYDEKVFIENSKSRSEFSFKWSTALPIGVNTEACGIKRLFSNNELKTRIEKDAYEFLLLHGVMQDIDDENLREVFKGVYEDKNNENLFIVNNNAFTVSEYDEINNYIVIKSNTLDDIRLYVLNDLIVRVRAREIKEKYIKIKKCEFKRDLTGETCLPVMISERLKLKLDVIAKKSANIKINDADVVQYEQIPGGFKKDNKLYFYHDGFMFKAEVSYLVYPGIDPQTKIVDLFIKTFFKTKKHITSFVVDIKNDRIELKEPSLFLAEKTGIEPEEYEFYFKNNKYYAMPNFLELNSLVNEVNKHGSLQIIDPISKPFQTLDAEKILDLCHMNFFPSINEPDFTILSLDYITDNDPFYFRSSKVTVLSHLRQAKHILNIASEELEKLTENAEIYIKSMLKTERHDIAKEFATHLHNKLKIVNSNLNRNNIKLVSINRVPISDGDHKFYLFHAALDEELRRQGTFAFTVADNTKKIYISIDKLHFIDPEHPDISLRNPPAIDITDLLIHEATHIDNLTTDLFYLQRDNQGQMLPILDEVDNFLANIKKAPPSTLNKIIQVNKNYLNKVKIYAPWRDKILTDDVSFLYFSSSDLGVLANYYLHNADFMTKIVRDIYQNSFVDRSQFSYLEKLGQRILG